MLYGSTHLIDAIIFSWPPYRLSALIRFLTAIISLLTAFKLIQLMPRLLASEQKDDDQQDEMEALKISLLAKENKIKELEALIKS